MQEPALKNLLIRLDMALTGKPENACASTARQQEHMTTPLAFHENNDAFYLSDGGLSRVLWVQTSSEGPYGGIGISGVSRKEVVEKWRDDKAVAALRREINALMSQALTALDDRPSP
jgi:hypothetical protein